MQPNETHSLLTLEVVNVFTINLVDRRTGQDVVFRQLREQRSDFLALDNGYQMVVTEFYKRANEALLFNWHRDRTTTAFINIYIGRDNNPQLVKHNRSYEWQLFLPDELSNVEVIEVVDRVMAEIVTECQAWIRTTTPTVTMDLE